MQRFFIAGALSPTNVRLLDALRAHDVEAALLPVEAVARRARPGDVALARVDVSPTLDGVEGNLGLFDQLERAGVFVLNRPAVLLAAHDKLTTAIRLREAGLPHPRTSLVDELPPQPPLVVKPRFGSWGRDVFLCPDRRALRRTQRTIRGRSWYMSQGALVQELVPTQGEDLRVVIAGGEVVGAIRRIAPPGEWRTNVALGARRVPVAPPADACALAVAAAETVGADFVGVDLLPTDDGHVVLELNGCVDLTDAYSLGETNVFDAIAEQLISTADAAFHITDNGVPTRPLLTQRLLAVTNARETRTNDR